MSSGGRYPAGCDKSYPHHCVYPGVLPFYRELDLGYNGDERWTQDRIGNLVFLSARPHVYKDLTEKVRYIYTKYVEYGGSGVERER